MEKWERGSAFTAGSVWKLQFCRASTAPHVELMLAPVGSHSEGMPFR
jgi:hypothetical protein